MNSRSGCRAAISSSRSPSVRLWGHDALPGSATILAIAAGYRITSSARSRKRCLLQRSHEGLRKLRPDRLRYGDAFRVHGHRASLLPLHDAELGAHSSAILVVLD